jgi:O-antigen/teichoic acid export membrane protein
MWTKIKSFLFENKTTSQTLAKNTFWLGASNIAGRLLRSIIIIYAARVLGSGSWGAFSYAITLAAFLTIFTDFGINHVINRDLAKTTDDDERRNLISTSFFLKIGLLVPGVLLLIFVAPHISNIPEAIPLFSIVALIVIGDTMREFAGSVNRAFERMEREIVFYGVTNLGIIVFGFLFLAWSKTAEAFAYGYAAGTTLGTLTSFWMLRHELGQIFSRFTTSLIKPILSSSWPFAISGFLGILMLNTDIILIGWFLDADQVGYYSAPQRIIQILYLIPSVIATSALPMFARLAQEKSNSLRPIVEKIMGVTLGLAFPIAIGGTILGADIISLVFGSAYLPGAVPFQILMATMIVDFPAVILSNMIFAHNQQRSLIIFSALGGFSNVTLDLLLIPKFGIIGSAWATLGAQIIGNAYLWFTAKKIMPFNMARHLNGIILGTILMGLATFTIAQSGISTLYVIAISAGIYLLFLYHRKEPLLKDIRSILLQRN